MKPIDKTKEFKKHYQKRIAPYPNLTKRFNERARLFVQGERDYPLHDHALEGNKLGLRSFSITGDIRVVYKETDDAYVFLDVGSHNQVYGD